VHVKDRRPDLCAGDGIGAVEPGVVDEVAVLAERAGEALVRLELRVHPHGSPRYDSSPDSPDDGEVGVADDADELDAVRLPRPADGPSSLSLLLAAVVVVVLHGLPVLLRGRPVGRDLVADPHPVPLPVHGPRHGDGLPHERLPRQGAVHDHVPPLVQRRHQQRRRRVRRRLVHLYVYIYDAVIISHLDRAVRRTGRTQQLRWTTTYQLGSLQHVGVVAARADGLVDHVRLLERVGLHNHGVRRRFSPEHPAWHGIGSQPQGRV